MDYTSEAKESSGGLRLVFGDVVFGVHGEDFHCLFSYQTGGLESLVSGGREWLYRTPKPTFWRAATDNDKGNGFPFRSSMWLGADLYMETTDIRISVDQKRIKRFRAPDNNRFAGSRNAKEASVTYTYRTATKPHTKVDVCYTVEETGRVGVEVFYHGKKGLPQLPVFGMRFIFPDKAAGYEYQGLSGETYPDRMAGGVKGTWQVEGLPVTPYLVPQDCGVHMDTDRLTVRRTGTDGEPHSITFEKTEEPFAFSCLPYTAEELENATHQEELPPERRTVVCILGAVRGVGGIDSWGRKVEDYCQIDSSKDRKYSFTIQI